MRRRLVTALIALALGTTAQADPHQAQFIQKLEWPTSAHQLGGFSGLELSRDGTQYVAASDDGVMLYGRIKRGPDGIKALTIERRRKLVTGRDRHKDAFDAEGVAVTPKGTLYVSFERHHRVERFDSKGPGRALPSGNAFDGIPHNGGFEAMAIDKRGRLLAIPELSGRINRDFDLWRFDGAWQRIAKVPRRGGFLPVGADVGPHGRLFILERAFSGFGFRSRVRSFAISANGLTGERTHLVSPIWRYDNLEGLSVWQDRAGQLRLTMISDDNFNNFQSTQIVEYALPLATASANR